MIRHNSQSNNYLDNNFKINILEYFLYNLDVWINIKEGSELLRDKRSTVLKSEQSYFTSHY